MRYLRCLVLAVVVSVLFAGSLVAEEFKIKINSSPHEWVIEDSGQSEKPTIRIIGVTDTSVQGEGE